jgi:hypothetical protein
MSYEEACMREIAALNALEHALIERSHIDAKVAVYTDHREAYEERVSLLLAAAQAYEAASSEVLQARVV